MTLSIKLMNARNVLKLPFADNGTGFFNEDDIMCVYYRKQLEDYGILFAPVPLASKFSREKDCNDSYDYPFGFHNNRQAIPKLFFVKHALRKTKGRIIGDT